MNPKDTMTWLWRLLVGITMSSALALSGWAMTTIANIPKEYTPKEEVQQLRKENREDHKELERKIDRLIDYIIEGEDEN